MRRGIALSLVGACALAGCGGGDGDDATTPAACLAGPGAYEAALRDAPGEVRLEGETPISACLVAEQQSGELGTVGETVIEVATGLNAQARREPGPEATVRLGYLVGAVQQGASATEGIHADLVRRLDAAARFAPAGELPRSFERAFGRGYAAGQDSG